MLFSSSIRDNIAYGAVDPEAVTTEDIYRAARVANAYNFIQAFPQGFDTVVGEKGVLLSGETQAETRQKCVAKTTLFGIIAGLQSSISIQIMESKLFREL